MAEQGPSAALLTLEAERKVLAKSKLNSYYSLGLGLVAIVAGLVSGRFALAGILIGILFLLAGVYFFIRVKKRVADYAYYFKQKVLRAALLDIDPSLRIEPQKGLTEAAFRFSQLFTQEPDRMQSEDQVSGWSGKTAFSFSEVYAEYKTVTHSKNGRQEHWHDIFKGIIFIADFNKPFTGTTLVRPRDTGNAIGAWIAEHAPLFSSNRDTLVHLEDPEFCKAFVTYATDQVEARYILTPALMERLCDLNSRSQDTLSLSFTGNCMYIAFPLDTNYFEPPLFKTLLDPGLLKDDLEIVRFMHSIAQDLDLNTRIWGKK